LWGGDARFVLYFCEDITRLGLLSKWLFSFVLAVIKDIFMLLPAQSTPEVQY